jgi:hypothetical protein
MTVTNPGPSDVQVTLIAYTPRGSIASRTSITPRAGQSLAWSPGQASGHLGVTVSATGPVVVTGQNGQPLSAAPAPRSTWYAVHPGATAISVFNPNDDGVHVDVQFEGGSLVKSEQIDLPRHRSFAVSAHGAQSVVLSTSAGVTVAPIAHFSGTIPVSDLSTWSVFTAAGRYAHVALFNPSGAPAHVTLRTIAGSNTTSRAIVLPVSRTRSLQVRTSGQGARGVIVSSDVPVVAVAAP